VFLRALRSKILRADLLRLCVFSTVCVAIARVMGLPVYRSIGLSDSIVRLFDGSLGSPAFDGKRHTAS
jgi:hypothetical protein